MKNLLMTAALVAASCAPASAGTYPFMSGTKHDCIVWAILPFPCHEGFGYVEPGGGDPLDIEVSDEVDPPYVGDPPVGDKPIGKGGDKKKSCDKS